MADERRWYAGPIKVGMRFVWLDEPLHPRITVLQVELYEEEALIQTTDDTRKNKCWNSEDRFREAVQHLEPSHD